MGHTIIDCRTFIKTTRGIIPLVLGGSNNCYDIVRGKDFKLRELRERYWSVLLDLVELPEEEILAKFENLIPDNSIECWVYNGKWLNGAQAQKWFARGVKDATRRKGRCPAGGHSFQQPRHRPSLPCSYVICVQRAAAGAAREDHGRAGRLAG